MPIDRAGVPAESVKGSLRTWWVTLVSEGNSPLNLREEAGWLPRSRRLRDRLRQLAHCPPLLPRLMLDL